MLKLELRVFSQSTQRFSMFILFLAEIPLRSLRLCEKQYLPPFYTAAAGSADKNSS
jgi:hypothetical protein